MAPLLAARRLRHPPHADLPGAGVRRPMSRPAVNPALAGVALAVVVGAVVAGSARNARTAILGLVVTMVGAPLLADPLAGAPRPGRPAGRRRPGRLSAVGRDARSAAADRRLARRLADRRVPGHRRRGRRATAATAWGRRRPVRRWPPRRVRPGRPGRPAGRHRPRHPAGRARARPPARRRAPRPDEPRRHPRRRRAAHDRRPRRDARRGRGDPRRRGAGRSGAVRLRACPVKRTASRRPSPIRQPIDPADEPRAVRSSSPSASSRALGLARPLGVGPRRRRVGVVGLVRLAVAAAALQPGQILVVDGGGLAATAYTCGSSSSSARVVGLGLACQRPRRRLAPRRAGRDARHPRPGGLTLGLVDPRAAVLVGDGRRPVRRRSSRSCRRTAGRGDRRHPRDAGGRRRGRAGDRRDGLVRARPEPAGRPAGRLRAGLPRLRRRGRDAVRRDPVPPVGRPAEPTSCPRPRCRS